MFDRTADLPPIASADCDGPRSLDEAKAWMLDRSDKAIHPMNNLESDDVKTVLEQLDGLDPVRWAAAWRRAGEAAWDAAGAAEDPADRRTAYLPAERLFLMVTLP